MFILAYQFAGILIVLLVDNIIVVAMIFSNPTKLANEIVSMAGALLASYGDGSEEGNTSILIWDLLMEV